MRSLFRNWREAEWAVRGIYFLIAAEIGTVIAVVLWFGF